MTTIYDLLGKTVEELAEIIKNKKNHYLSYPIAKANGKKRWIDAPQKELKGLQTAILYKFLYRFRPHGAAVGFRKNYGVSTGAKRHLGNKVILCMDLSNFFHSISFNHVIRELIYLGKNLEQRDSDFKFTTNTAVILAELVTYKHRLPQGAPTSPALANLISMKMDISLQVFSKKRGLTYTRYADDLTFSHPELDFDFTVEDISEIIGIIKEQGFKLNYKKTRIMRPHRRMSVTGVVINEKLGVAKWKWRNLRAKLYNLSKSSKPLLLKDQQILRGQIEWINSLNPHRGKQLLNALGKLILKT